ncbi:odorant receptor 2a [Orussus abietinus]|uniref:odorant receptor 2a n=1 Tax=Orussus abietinus TaxID=222816 RepID=UPI000C716361|nr:odorant receptor 2a [Orussus abietinus]
MITNKDHPKSAKVRNKFYETDLEEDIGLIRCLMKSIGLWYSKTENSPREKFMSIISIMAYTLLHVVVLVPFFIEIVFMEKDFRKQVENASPLIGSFIGEIKYLCILYYKKDVCNYIDSMSEDWRKARMKPDREFMLQSTKFGQKLTRPCMISMYTGCVGYVFINPVLSGDLLSRNDTSRTLAFPCYYHVFDVHRSPNFEIMYITQIVFVVTSATCFIVACALTVKFTFHICAQCRIVRSLFEDVIDGDQQQDLSFDERWSYAIKAHLRVLRFVNDAVSVLKGVCLTELLGCSVVTCLIGLTAIWHLQEKNNGDCLMVMIIFTAFVLNLFIYCFISEQLTHQYAMIGETLYDIQWYRLPPKKASEIVIILAICNIPVHLTAGKISELSISVFCDVFKATMVYLNVLRELML